MPVCPAPAIHTSMIVRLRRSALAPVRAPGTFRTLDGLQWRLVHGMGQDSHLCRTYVQLPVSGEVTGQKGTTLYS